VYQLDKTLRQIAAGSLEIETGTQAVDFCAIVLDNTVPNNFHATSVAEVQNIYYLTQEIAQNFQVGLMPICKHCARMIKRPIRPLPSLNG
jgi:hypothetical protein